MNKRTVCIGREEREGFLDGRQGTRVSPEEGKALREIVRKPHWKGACLRVRDEIQENQITQSPAKTNTKLWGHERLKIF